jgi:nitroreductase
MVEMRRNIPELHSDRDDWPEASKELSDLLAERFSCRAFLSKSVPRVSIERMLAIAQLSASWCNSQPWQVIVTEGQGTERIREALYSHARSLVGENLSPDDPKMDSDFPFPLAYRGVYKERRRAVGWQLYESVGIAHGDRAGSAKQVLDNFRLFGAPHMMLITSERDLGVYGAIDCGLYMGTLLMAAQSMGIGMIPQAALASYATLIRKHFGLTENRVVIAGASFGYADVGHPANSFRSQRADLAQAVSWVSE